MSDSKDKKIIIEGITDTGETFRPSNWAERMSGSLSTFRNRRIVYSPMLQPVYKDGYNCVALDPTLKETNPELYQSILNFAEKNHLRICNEDDETSESSEGNSESSSEKSQT